MAVGRVERVGAGQLEHGQRGRRLAVEVAVDVVVLRPQLDAFVDDAPIGISVRVPDNVLEMDHAAVCAGLEHDVFELLFGGQPSGRVDRQLKLDRLRRLGTGGCPSRPAATWRFCSRTALITSLAVRSRAASLSGSSQTRML